MGHEALDIYKRMPANMLNTVSYVCILNACSNAKLIEQARSIFNGIEQKTATIVTTMVSCGREAQLESCCSLLRSIVSAVSIYWTKLNN